MFIPMINDMHVHFRQGKMMKKVVKHSAKRCIYAMVMPNTTPAIMNPNDVRGYYVAIKNELLAKNSAYFTPLMTAKLTMDTTPEMINDLSELSNFMAMKLYPEGVTTNSEGGGIGREEIINIKRQNKLLDTLGAMEKYGVVLSVHGEMPEAFCLDREKQFILVINEIMGMFPKLKIVMEHITNKETVEFIYESKSNNLAGTITLHHLYLTLDDVIGDKINVHNFCKPIAKRKQDRDALLTAAMDSNYLNSGKFFFGSDSAPHDIEMKECAHGCAGVFTAPVMLEMLVELFDSYGKLGILDTFTRVSAAKFYGLKNYMKTIEVVRKPWVVPKIIDGIVPFWAEKELKWQIVD